MPQIPSKSILAALGFGALLFAPVHAGIGQQAISASGIQAGLCVQVGAADASVLLEAAQDNRFMVHGLASEAQSLASTRAAIMAQGRYGQVSVEKVEGFAALPYGDNLVNLLIADLDQLGAKAPSDKELERVVTPGGAAYVKKGGAWAVRKKARPDQYGTWSHFFANSEGTQVSDDRALGVATTVKWMANHQWGATSADTESRTQFRIDKNVSLYVFPRGDGRGQILVARDAFNGVLLWAREAPAAATSEVRFRFVTDNNRVFYFDKAGGYAICVDGLTGKTLREYTNGLKMSTKYAKRETYQATLAVGGGKLLQTDGSQVAVLDIETGDLKWKYTAPNGLWPMRAGISAAENKAFFIEANAPVWGHPYENITYTRWPLVDSARALTVIDLNGDGTPAFRKELPQIPAYSGCMVNDMAAPYAAHSPKVQQVAYSNGKIVIYSNHSPAFFMVYDMKGNLLWTKSWVGHEHNKANTIQYQMVLRKDTVYAVNGNAFIGFNLATGAHDSTQVRLAKVNPCFMPALLFAYSNNPRCTRPTASENMYLLGFGMFVDRDHNYAFVNSTRSHCGAGAHIGNGMAYYTTHNCNCLGRSLSNYQAQKFEPLPAAVPDAQRLALTSQLPPKGQWTQTLSLPGELSKDWGIQYNNSSYYHLDTACNPKGGGPGIGMQSVCGTGKGSKVERDGYTFTLALNEHRIECARGGTRLWSFIADGRISSHPVVSGDLAVFGSHDGYVYAVKLSDGTPAWRFLAAHALKKMVAHGQLESCWPVFGTHLANGKVVVTAGRHPAMDGGLTTYGLDPATGAVAWKKVVRAEVLRFARTVPAGRDVPSTALNTDSLKSTGIDPANPQDKSWRTMSNTQPGTPVVELPAVALSLREDRHNAALADKTGKIRFSPLGYHGDNYVFRIDSPGAHTVALYSAGGRKEFGSTSEEGATYEISKRMLKPGRYVARITDKSGRGLSVKLILGD